MQQPRSAAALACSFGVWLVLLRLRWEPCMDSVVVLSKPHACQAAARLLPPRSWAPWLAQFAGLARPL